MTLTAPPPTVENLRRALAPGGYIHDFDAETLVDARSEAFAAARSILESSAGRNRLASEQRKFDALNEHIDLIDKVNARMADEFRAQRAKVERRENEAADIRSQHLGMFGQTGSSRGADIGQALADAIGEVREGRQVAYVDVENRAISEGGSGGYAVPMQLAPSVFNLTAASVVMSLPGIRTFNMTSDRARFPRFGSATVAPVAEGATIGAAATDIDAVDVVAVKFGSLEVFSSEWAEDASPEALSMVSENLLRQLAIRVDLGLLEGTGALDCVGIRNVVGANSTSVAATPASFTKFRDAEYELRLDNADPKVWVLHPRTWKTLSGIKTGIASDETTLLEPDPQQGPRTLLGYPVAVSSQITLTEGTNGSWAALLDTSQLMVCERRPARLEVSRDYKFAEDSIAVKATWRGNLAALNPEAISLLTDVRA
jgi:HK97 family phage major capsid protein